MKKFICSLLTITMLVGMVTSVSATQTITFTDNGDGQVTSGDEVIITEEEPSQKVQETEKKTGFDEILSSVFEKDKKDTSVKKGYLALGSDLTNDQLATVLGLLGITRDDLDDYELCYTTNAEEHEALDKYISPSLIGKRSLSSVMVKPAEAGHGVVVTTKNINYCTTNMYRNALITAGVTDADITVVAPTPISGTAALIGALKAYEKMSGKDVSQTAIDTSLNELVTTGQVAEAVGDDAQAEELIAYIKTVVATNDLNTKEEIEAAIRKGMTDLNVTLTEDEIKQIVDLMLKIKAMGIDYSVLAEQADDIYAKYKDQIKAGTFDINKVDLNDLGLKEIISKAISSSVKSMSDTVKSFFGSLFK